MSQLSTTIPDINDSEILKIEKVLQVLNERQATSVNLEAFRKEAIERFAEIGFGIDVKVYDTNVTGIYAFDFELRERLSGEFDPDKQVHETVSDILSLGTGGTINTSQALKAAEANAKKPKGGHTHGKSKLWTPPGSV